MDMMRAVREFVVPQTAPSMSEEQIAERVKMATRIAKLEAGEGGTDWGAVLTAATPLAEKAFSTFESIATKMALARKAEAQPTPSPTTTAPAEQPDAMPFADLGRSIVALFKGGQPPADAATTLAMLHPDDVMTALSSEENMGAMGAALVASEPAFFELEGSMQWLELLGAAALAEKSPEDAANDNTEE